MGRPAYPQATELLITADGGGSNGSRARLWKTELQRLADETGLRITVCHFPPGTSKWNKIEHRMFCHITQNWRGRPLVSHEVIVRLIGSTTTRAGPDDPGRSGHRHVSHRRQSHRRGTRRRAARARRFPRRLELHHRPTPANYCSSYSLTTA